MAAVRLKVNLEGRRTEGGKNVRIASASPSEYTIYGQRGALQHVVQELRPLLVAVEHSVLPARSRAAHRNRPARAAQRGSRSRTTGYESATRFLQLSG